MKRLFLILWLSLALCPAATAAPQVFDLAEETTRIEIENRSALHSFSGRALSVTGRMTVDLDSGTLVSPANIKIPVEDIDTGNTARDHALAYTLKADRQKKIEFTAVSAGSGTEGKEKYTLRGYLMIGGVRRDIDIPVNVVIKNDVIEADGETRLSLKKFELRPPPLARMMGLSDEVIVRFHSVWRKAAHE